MDIVQGTGMIQGVLFKHEHTCAEYVGIHHIQYKHWKERPKSGSFEQCEGTRLPVSVHVAAWCGRDTHTTDKNTKENTKATFSLLMEVKRDFVAFPSSHLWSAEKQGRRGVGGGGKSMGVCWRMK